MTLEIDALHARHHRSPVLVDINLRVAEHALACIVGPSGCGKTTLLRVIGGFHPPTAGRVALDHQVFDEPPATHVPAERRRIGYIPQDGALFPHLTVAGNIGFGLRRDRRARSVAGLLELVDLPALADRYPHQLSGGQQQRVAIARALAAEPALLLLDEPFTALDASLRTQVRNDVVDLLRATGTAAVLVTHDPVEALAIADQVTIMEGGRVVQTGVPDELHARPVSVAAARALGDSNVVDATAAGPVAVTALGELSLQSPSRATKIMVLVRPKQLAIESTGTVGGVAAQVRRVEYRGEDYRFELAVDGVPEVMIALGSARYDVGSNVRVRVVGPVHVLG